jgi:hypothetical protein
MHPVLLVTWKRSPPELTAESSLLVLVRSLLVSSSLLVFPASEVPRSPPIPQSIRPSVTEK